MENLGKDFKISVVKILEMSDSDFIKEINGGGFFKLNRERNKKKDLVILKFFYFFLIFLGVVFGLLGVASIFINVILSEISTPLVFTIYQKFTIALVMFATGFILIKASKLIKRKITLNSIENDEISEVAYIKLAIIAEVDSSVKEECKEMYSSTGKITNIYYAELYKRQLLKDNLIFIDSEIMNRIKKKVDVSTI